MQPAGDPFADLSADPSQIVRSSAQELYGSKQADWPPPVDRWNDYKFARMERFVLDTGSHLLPGQSRILDAGDRHADSIGQLLAKVKYLVRIRRHARDGTYKVTLLFWLN